MWEGARSSLPKAIFKSILVVVGIGAVLIAVVGVGGYLWFQQKKEEIREMGREARAEGRAYGRGRSPEECIAERSGASNRPMALWRRRPRGFSFVPA